MKLLHDFFRQHLARRTPFVRDGAAVPELRGTVSPPLKHSAHDQAVRSTQDAASDTRREPPSFLKSSRHRRGVARR